MMVEIIVPTEFIVGATIGKEVIFVLLFNTVSNINFF